MPSAREGCLGQQQGKCRVQGVFTIIQSDGQQIQRVWANPQKDPAQAQSTGLESDTEFLACSISSHFGSLLPSCQEFTSSVQHLQLLPLVLSTSTCQQSPVHGQEAGRGMSFLMLLNFWPSSFSAPCCCRMSLPLDLMASSQLFILVFCSLAFCFQTVLLLKCKTLQWGFEVTGQVKLRGSCLFELSLCLQVSYSEGA